MKSNYYYYCPGGLDSNYYYYCPGDLNSNDYYCPGDLNSRSTINLTLTSPTLLLSRLQEEGGRKYINFDETFTFQLPKDQDNHHSDSDYSDYLANMQEED